MTLYSFRLLLTLSSSSVSNVHAVTLKRWLASQSMRLLACPRMDAMLDSLTKNALSSSMVNSIKPWIASNPKPISAWLALTAWRPVLSALMPPSIHRSISTRSSSVRTRIVRWLAAGFAEKRPISPEPVKRLLETAQKVLGVKLRRPCPLRSSVNATSVGILASSVTEPRQFIRLILTSNTT